MSTILFISSNGTDDPTRASLPFISAAGAMEAGHIPEICLLGEATYLVKDTILNQVHGVGFRPLRDVVPPIVAHRVPVYV